MAIGRLWAGRVYGTSTGNVFLNLEGEDIALTGTLRFNEPEVGIVVYSLTGAFDGTRFEFVGTTQTAIEGAQFGDLKGSASLQPDGKLEGQWETTIGSAGTFLLFPHRGSETTPAAEQPPDQMHKHINQFVQARLKGFQEGQGHAAINRGLAVFRTVHNYVKDLHEQPVKAIKWSRHFLEEPEERIRWLTAEELTRLLEHLPDHARVAVHWSVLTGMRLAATYDLTWRAIDFGKAECRIIKKGGKTQVIVLSPDALSLLAALPRHGAFVFERRNRRKIFEKALADAGIENFRWHDLRHTHATLLRQAGVALEIVQRSLGHQSIKTTQRYAHVADHEMRAALQKLPSITPVTDGSATVIPLKRKES